VQEVLEELVAAVVVQLLVKPVKLEDLVVIGHLRVEILLIWEMVVLQEEQLLDQITV
jgi:hypothetical protein